MNGTAWYDSLAEPVRRVFDGVVEYLPNLVGALVLVLIGWVLGRLLGALARRLTRYGLARLGRTRSFASDLERQSRYRSLPVVVGRFVFWIALLFFIAAGIEALGLPAVSDLFGNATEYLPRVLLATLIIFAGILLGDLARRWSARAAARAGIAFATPVGRAAHAVVVVVAAMIAIDQLGVESTVLLIAVAVAAGSAFGATALAFGLGAGPTVGNIIAAHYVQRTYRIGHTVRIGDLQGAIVDITRTAVMLDTPDGRVLVPARRFAEEVSILVQPG